MKTSLNVYDYPEPKEEKEHTLKVECSFTTYVTVYGDNRENWDTQIKEISKYDLLEEADIINIEDYEKID